MLSMDCRRYGDFFDDILNRLIPKLDVPLDWDLFKDKVFNSGETKINFLDTPCLFKFSWFTLEFFVEIV